LDESALMELGWAKLLAGETLHVVYGGSQLQLLGALRASEGCADCHKKNGALLGAYRYNFHEIPDD